MSRKILSLFFFVVLVLQVVGCAGLGNSVIPGDGWVTSGEYQRAGTAGSIIPFSRSVSLTKFDKRKVFDLSIASDDGWTTSISPTHIELEDGVLESSAYTATVNIPPSAPEGTYTVVITISELTQGDTFHIPLEVQVLAPTTTSFTETTPFTKDVDETFFSQVKIETGAHDGVNNRYIFIDGGFPDALEFKDPKAGGVSMEPFKTSTFILRLLPLTNAVAKHFTINSHVEAVSGVLNLGASFDVVPDADMSYTIDSTYDNAVGVSPTGGDPTAQYVVHYNVAAGHPGAITITASGLDPEYGATITPSVHTISPAGGTITFTVTVRCNTAYTGAEKFMITRLHLVHDTEPSMDRRLGIPVRIIP